MLLTQLSAGILVSVIAFSSVGLGLAVVTDRSRQEPQLENSAPTASSKAPTYSSPARSPWENRPLVLPGPKF